MRGDTKEFTEVIDWEEKAQKNPLYAIMSEDIFIEAESAPTPSQIRIFYAKGNLLWNKYFNDVFSLFPDPTKIRVFEYGCGMGRLLSVPARAGAACIGVDISATQLSLAREHAGALKNARLLQAIPGTTLAIETGSVDFAYSFAVFQHIKDKSALLFALREIARVTKAGGYVKLQIPCHHPFFDDRYVIVKKIPFEAWSLVVYLKKNLFYLPVIKKVKHNHWAGAVNYFQVDQFLRTLMKLGLKIAGLQYDDLGALFIIARKESG